MSKRLLLITGNFYPELTGIGKYNGEMIEWLSKNSFTCTVITTFPYYPEWKVQKEYKKSRWWYKKEVRQLNDPGAKPITIIRCPHYIPTSPTGLKRLLSEFTISFFAYIAVFFVLFSKRHSFVLTVAPPFELGLLGVLYKKIRRAKFIYHVQDLQIDAARELGMIKSSAILKSLGVVEKYILKNADYISTISEGMMWKLQKKCSKKSIYFPNWVDTNLFYPMAGKGSLKQQFGFKATDRIILYSGAIGEKQGLKELLHVAKHFEKNDDVKFVISGSGPYKIQLVELKEKLGLENFTFLPLQHCSKFNSFLNVADFHLILQKSKAGDLVMPSKLSTILATGGVAIVTANPGTSLYDIMNSSDMGIIVEPENQEMLTKAIQDALSIDTTMKKLNARKFAESNLSINMVLANFVKNALNETKLVDIRLIQQNSVIKETIDEIVRNEQLAK
ncbi:MAG: WcaI family glycosyltransferase [Chitinophagaceae bacterium]